MTLILRPHNPTDTFRATLLSNWAREHLGKIAANSNLKGESSMRDDLHTALL